MAGVAVRLFQSGPYSPNVVEGEFCEVRLQDPAYNAAVWLRGWLLGLYAPRERELHVVVLNKDAGGRITPASIELSAFDAPYFPQGGGAR
jgi:hypothetical protein